MSIHNPIPQFLTYRVHPSSEVTVAIAIGDAQTGGWAFGFGPDGVTKGSGDAPTSVGKGADLVGKMLQVVATVVDVRPETNRLSAVVTLAGGPGGAKNVTSSFDGGSAGDSALLTTLVMFE